MLEFDIEETLLVAILFVQTKPNLSETLTSGILNIVVTLLQTTLVIPMNWLLIFPIQQNCVHSTEREHLSKGLDQHG